ncbi:hypothetical protein Lfu02_44340 [Longispora fulva]|uniref:Uncharacterized protein n=1 Tax=Longispora fulva TaxID=619741 RepID=A0A8J7GTF8_9ACTN|nr:hypothetical protein [Longispora fulva]MBG6136891.1 hypothetical protein [Longispora fulva]GIG60062.1 hypothetical protein Lfu02_44340 [Longispora fulva]
MVLAILATGEVLFLLSLLAGLVARYPLRMPRTGAALLLAAPVIDLVLLVATAVDLGRGGTAGVGHGLAAVYLGFSVAYGHSMVRWADQRFAHRFAGGPPPARPPRYGTARALHEWREFGKLALACVIAAGLLEVGVLYVDDASRTAALTGWITRMGVVVAIGFVWSATYTVFPKRERS